MKYLIVFLCGLTAFSPSSNAQEFKVMTYNIQGSYHIKHHIYRTERWIPWQMRRDGVYAVIDEAQPDIFALQEDTIDQTNDVNAHFTSEGRQKRYQRVPIIERVSGGISGDGLYDGLKEHSYGSIFFDVAKFKRVDYGEFEIETGFDSFGRNKTKYAKWVQLRHIASQKELFVSNVHFTHRGSPSADGYAERLDRQEDSAEELAKVMWSKVGDTAYISFGDMNNFATSRPIQFLTSDKDAIDGMIYSSNHRRLQIDDTRLQSDDDDVVRLIINNILDNSAITIAKNRAAKLIDHILTSEELTKPYNTQRYNRNFKFSDVSEPCNVDDKYTVMQLEGAGGGLLDSCRESDHFAVMATIRFKESPINSSRYYNYLKKANTELIPKNLLTGSYFNELNGLPHTLNGGPSYSLGNGWNIVPSGAQLTIEIDDSDNTGTQSSPAGHPSHLRLNVEPGVGNTNAYLGINQKIDDRYLELESAGFGHVSFYAKTNTNKTLETYFHLGALDSSDQVEKVVSVENLTINDNWTRYDRCFSMPEDYSGSSTTDMRFTIGYQDQLVSDLENDLTIDNIVLRPVDSCQ